MNKPSVITQIIVILLFIIIGLIACSNDYKVQVNCEIKAGLGPDALEYKRIYLIDSTKSEAFDVTFSEINKGSLIVTENTYKIYFSGDTKHWDSFVEINRYTGDISIEIGRKPFNSSNSHNDIIFGTCKLVKPNKL